MKPHIAIIGSCVCDIIVEVPKLPTTGEDVHIKKQTLALGGCAYNVSNILQFFKVPYILFSPIGEGIYADFIRTELKHHQTHSLLEHVGGENGCCYCMVEDSGERTFISYHGVEYQFKEKWFKLLESYPIDTVYICGLEIEEDTGIHIITYLQSHKNLTIYFAPGPRICEIDPYRMKSLFDLSCILHINEKEALEYTQKQTLQKASAFLYSQSHAPVIVTLGERGSYCFDGINEYYSNAITLEVVDTIGAGDAHIGAIISHQNELDWQKLLEIANHISAHVVTKKGAGLDTL